MTNRERETVTQQKTLLELRRSLKRHGDKMLSQGFTGYIFILDGRQTWPNWSFAINQEAISRNSNIENLLYQPIPASAIDE